MSVATARSSSAEQAIDAATSPFPPTPTSALNGFFGRYNNRDRVYGELRYEF